MKTHYSWVARGVLTCSVAVTAVIALADPTSQHRRAIEGGDPFLSVSAAASMILLLMACFVSFADLICNDALARRMKPVYVLHRWRHVVFMFMSISQVALAWMMIHSSQIVEFALLRYTVDGAWTAVVAICGVRDHYYQRLHSCCQLQRSAP